MSSKQTIDPDRVREMFLEEARSVIDRIAPSIEGAPQDVMVIVTAAMMTAFSEGILKAHKASGLSSDESERTIVAFTKWGLELAQEIDLHVVGTKQRIFDGKLRVVRSDKDIDLGDDA